MGLQVKWLFFLLYEKNISSVLGPTSSYYSDLCILFFQLLRNTVSVEVYQDWLEKVGDAEASAQAASMPKRQKTDEDHHHDEHQHEHDHHHEPRADVEATAVEKEGRPAQYQVIFLGDTLSMRVLI